MDAKELAELRELGADLKRELETLRVRTRALNASREPTTLRARGSDGSWFHGTRWARAVRLRAHAKIYGAPRHSHA